MAERWRWLHVEGSRLLHVWLRRELHRACGELRVHGLCKTLGGHGEVLLGGYGVLVDGRSHRPHGGLQVVLGTKPGGPLLASGVLEAWRSSLMGHVIPGPRLTGPLEATGAIKPHGAIEAHRTLLLEAHRPRTRTGAHVVKAPRTFEALHRAL